MPLDSLRLRRHHRKALDQLPRGTEVILEKPRWQWVADAAKAMVSATTPSGRWLLLRDGFFHFQSIAPATFAQMAGFTFTSQETRFIWHFLVEYVHTSERHLGPMIQADHERERTRSRAGDPVDAPPPSRHDPREIVTETLPDHEKRRMY
jgi:hypothetical protein